MALGDTLKQLYILMKEIEGKVLDLEAENGEIAGFHFGNKFPSSPYPNQIVVRTDESPPQGGVMYRYDQSLGSWERLN